MISRASARKACSSSLTERGRTRARASSASGPIRDNRGRTAVRRVCAPRSTLSSTLRLAKTRPCWNVRATPSAAIASGDSRWIGWPSNRISPWSGRSSPLTMLKVVVLPAPLGPMRLTSSPSSIARSSDLTAATPPKRRVSPRISRRRGMGLDSPQQALRPETNEQQENDAIDENAVFGGDAEQLGEADERNRADDRAEHVAHPTQNNHRQREKRELGIERLVVEVGIEMRRDRARDARSETAESEGERLVAIEIDPIGLRRDLILPHGAQSAAEMRGEEPCLQGGDRNQHDKTGPVNRAIAIEITTEKGQRRNAGQSHRAPGEALPVENDEAHDLADRQGRDRDVMPTQAEGRKDEQRAKRGRYDPGRRDGSDCRRAEVGGEQRRRLPRDRQQRGVTERDLSGGPGDEGQTEGEHGGQPRIGQRLQ